MEEEKILNPLEFKMKQGQDANPFILFSSKGRLSINGIAAKMMGIKAGQQLLLKQAADGTFFITTLKRQGQALQEKKGGAMEFHNMGFCGLIISMINSKAPKEQQGKIQSVKFQILPDMDSGAWYRLANHPLKLLKREP